MSGGQLMVVLIVAIVMVASIVRAKYYGGVSSGGSPEDRGETLRLREEMKEIKERIRVIETIVTDRGAETASQIEALREHNRIESGEKTR